MPRTVAILAALLISATAAQAQSNKRPKVTPETGIPWIGDLDEGMKQAQARNVPILYIVTKDN